jgi:hypothetical protein
MTSERIRTVVEDLERAMLEFICKHNITHDEYRSATNLIIDEVEAGVASLLFDVFLEAAATDVGNVGRVGRRHGGDRRPLLSASHGSACRGGPVREGGRRHGRLGRLRQRRWALRSISCLAGTTGSSCR